LEVLKDVGIIHIDVMLVFQNYFDVFGNAHREQSTQIHQLEEVSDPADAQL
jgi:hypothetical protein